MTIMGVKKNAGTNTQNGQAAVELAVFGAILVFILGTVVRSALSSGFAQNQNFKAMRMAMLESWQGSKAMNMSRNSASVLYVQDRLSPDINKYGVLDRNPFIAEGAGSFSYNLLYPLDNTEVSANLPIMDVYINGQFFPFTTASYTTKTITRPAACPYAKNSCMQNQCLRNQREWVGGALYVTQFDAIVPVGTLNSSTDATMAANAQAIFTELANEGNITVQGSPQTATIGTVNSSTLSANFTAWLEGTFPSTGQAQINQIQTILQSSTGQYKLFFDRSANGSPEFSPNGPPSGSDVALVSTLALPYTTCPAAYVNSDGKCLNTNYDMQFDLQRLGDYIAVEQNVPNSMRQYMSWQWQATPGTTADSIGLNANNNQFPSYDIDGRLKEVTIYGISQASDGSPIVTFEDPQGGDIDSSWDTASCGPKPGLLNDSQIFTFTQDGTYLKIQEGKLYNPETDQFVRSASKRDTIDLVQRIVQLSNNTGRFCDAGGNRLSTVGNDGQTPNPVEVCIPAGSKDNCFSTQTNIKSTCYDENDNIIFVRSRLEDLRGHAWLTDTQGQLNVH